MMANSNGEDSCAHNDPETVSALHHQELRRGLKKIRTDHRLSDVTIVVGNKHVHAHKFVLSAMSPYFEAMFSGDMKESKEYNIKLENQDDEAVEMILDFFYTSNIEIQDTNVQALLAASSLLQVQIIQTMCCDYLRKHLDPTNCLGIRDIAEKYSCQNLVASAIAYALKTFEEVVKNEEFLELPVDRLIELISADTLDVTREEKVFEAVVQWTSYKDSQEDRNIHVDSIMEHVRFSQMNIEYLANLTETDKKKKTKRYVDEAKDYLLLSYKGKEARDYMCGPRFRKRAAMGESLYAVMCFESDGAKKTKIVKSLGPGTDKWTFISELLDDRHYSSRHIQMVALNGAFYCMSWSYKNNDLYNFFKSYDLTTNEWNEKLAQLKSLQSSAELVALNGYLYIIGGEGGPDRSNVVNRYDPVKNKWFGCAPLEYERIHFGAVVLESCIYAIGGKTDKSNNPTRTVERYDPTLNKWLSVAPMTIERISPKCVACNGYIYAIGGLNVGDCALKCAERYDPKMDSWELIAPMTEGHFDPMAVAMNGLIFVFKGSCLRSVAVYDTEKKIWFTRAQTANDDYPNVDDPRPRCMGLAVVERRTICLST